MTQQTDRKAQQGFTLVEVLIVILLFGIFMGAVYSLYVTHMKTAFRQEEVVDVQQNLRIAMDAVTRDLQMSGFLVPLGTPALDPGMSNVSSIRLNMASASKIYTHLTEDISTDAVQKFGPLSIATAAEANSFANVSSVRIVRPLTCSEPYSSTPASNLFRVDAVDPAASPPTITLRRPDNSAFTPDILYKAGDVLCGLDSTTSTSYPETVGYDVVTNDAACGPGQSCLRRQINSRSEIIAQNIVSLRFGYLLDDGTATGKEVSDPSGLTSDELENLRAVRVTITGQTMRVSTPGESPAVREMTSVVRLRNRR